MLFSNFIRTYQGNKNRKITGFEFFDSSAWNIAEFMREEIGKWAIDFGADKEFIKAFQSQDDQQHYAATFELLTHRLFTKAGFGLEKHPSSFETLKCPDFKAINQKTNDVIYLECTLAANAIQGLIEKNRIEAFEEHIEYIENFPFLVNISYIVIAGTSIPKKTVIKFLGEIAEEYKMLSTQELAEMHFSFKCNGWEIEFSLFRIDNSECKRNIGGTIGIGGKVYPSKCILTALKDKRPSKYGIDTSPYVICICINDMSADENSFAQALFGIYDKNKIDMTNHNADGFLLRNGNAKNTGVSAVIFFKSFGAFNLGYSDINVWHNPFAKNKISQGDLPFTEYLYEYDGVNWNRAKFLNDKDVFELLGVNKDEYAKSINANSLC